MGAWKRKELHFIFQHFTMGNLKSTENFKNYTVNIHIPMREEYFNFKSHDFFPTVADFDHHQRNALERMRPCNNLYTHACPGKARLFTSTPVLRDDSRIRYPRGLLCYLWAWMLLAHSVLSLHRLYYLCLCTGCCAKKIYVWVGINWWYFPRRGFLFAYAKHMGMLAEQQIFVEQYWGRRNTFMNKKWLVFLWISNRIYLSGVSKE